MGQEFEPFIWDKKDNRVFRFQYKVFHRGDDLSVLPFAVSENKVIGVLDAPEDDMETDNPALVLLKISK